MVSDYSGMMVQPHKAIVGANAFAHESGIHQDGMLKNRCAGGRDWSVGEVLVESCVGLLCRQDRFAISSGVRRASKAQWGRSLRQTHNDLTFAQPWAACLVLYLSCTVSCTPTHRETYEIMTPETIGLQRNPEDAGEVHQQGSLSSLREIVGGASICTAMVAAPMPT
jgi:hypothetical protein